MYLTNSIHDGQKKHQMVGLIDAETKMTKKMTLNYTEGTINSKSLITRRSQKFRGHEFHFSEVFDLPLDSKFAYDLKIGNGITKGKDGIILHETLASYGHLYFDSSNYAQRFVENCIKVSRR